MSLRSWTWTTRIPVEQGWCPQDARAQHWLHDGAPPPRRASRDSMVPVGVGGVTMMEGTCKCFSPGDAACVRSLPFPLLTHIFKPLRQDNLSPMFSSSQQDPALQPRLRSSLLELVLGAGSTMPTVASHLPQHPAALGCRSVRLGRGFPLRTSEAGGGCSETAWGCCKVGF